MTDVLPDARAAAADRGTVRYFTGRPCANGHVADRYTLNGACVVCQRAYTRANKAAIKAKRGAR